jgi:cytoskeletal protein CcmA (bactofilin family)
MLDKLRHLLRRRATVIGPDTVVAGAVQATHGLKIFGRLEGQVKGGGHVFVGRGGFVTGDIEAEDVTVGGSVEGSVIARNHLRLLATGVVVGDVQHRTLSVQRGGQFRGQTTLLEQAPQQAALDLPPQAASDRPQSDLSPVPPPLPPLPELPLTAIVEDTRGRGTNGTRTKQQDAGKLPS